MTAMRMNAVSDQTVWGGHGYCDCGI